MKNLLVIGLVLGLTNCSVSHGGFADDKIISESFTKTETRDLQLLVDFFNQTICDSNSKLMDCYLAFFNKVKQAADSGSIYLHIPFEQQQNIYETFEDSTFHQIWAFGNSLTHKNLRDTLKEIHYKWDGKFMNFLKIAGKKDKFIKEYHESVETFGGISPSLIAGIIMNHDKMNFEDPKVELVIAIHYLTLNDQYKRREKK